MEEEFTHSILIIDDEQEFADLVSRILESDGYSTLVASTGQEGVELAKLHHPSLVITDFFLPGVSGGTVIRQLKRARDTASIPILLMSGSDPSAFAGIHADGFLAKPFSMSALRDAVRSLTTAPRHLEQAAVA